MTAAGAARESAGRAFDRGFQPLRFRVFEALERGDRAEALRLALEAEARYPARGEVPFWLACIHCRLGEDEAALAALRGGLGRGLWWPDDWLLEDDDVASLRGSAAFAEVAAESAGRRRTAARRLTEPVVLAAASSPAAGPRAVVLALHGWGQEAGEFAAAWADVAERGFTVVVPESSEELTPGFFVWDDRAAARREVAAQYGAATAGTEAGRAALVLAGFSQGGGLAVDLALDDRPARVAGVLALSTGVEDLEAAPDPGRLGRAAQRGLCGRLVAGEADEALEGARVLAAAVSAAGLAWPLTELAGAGHQLPEPDSGLLPSELGLLLG